MEIGNGLVYAAGIVTTNWDPRPSSLATETWPLCAWTSSCTTAKPTPLPVVCRTAGPTPESIENVAQILLGNSPP